MPIKFDLEQLRKDHNCVNYFETGLWDPRKDISSKLALSCNFNKVYCIEIREDWVNMGKEIFKDEINKGRYHLFLDDSINMKKYISEIEEKTIFFLDAHVDDHNIHNFIKRCPLLDELEAIKSINRKDNIILIDDLRIINRRFPWGEKSYGNINFLEEIKKQILKINENYKFTTLDGFINDDILLAYV
jgi:hypothetical protein